MRAVIPTTTLEDGAHLTDEDLAALSASPISNRRWIVASAVLFALAAGGSAWFLKQHYFNAEQPAATAPAAAPAPEETAEAVKPFTGNFKVARFPDGTYEFRCANCSDFAHTNVDQQWIRQEDGSFKLRVDLKFKAGNKLYGGWFDLSLPEPGQVANLGSMEFPPVKGE